VSKYVSKPAQKLRGSVATVPRKPTPLEQIARPAELLERFALNPSRLAQIGAVVALAALIEFRIERVIWTAEGHSPKGQRPWTDGKPISELIARLRGSATGLGETQRKLAAAWCDAAEPAFRCRNSIVHGFPISLGGEWTNFTTNLRWEGELRKRPASTFSADDHTLDLIQAVFAILVRTLGPVEGAEAVTADDAKAQFLLRALREARSIASELEDLAAAVNREQY
jgi:hypothetical protein